MRKKMLIEFTDNSSKPYLELLDYVQNDLELKTEILEIQTFSFKQKILYIPEKQLALQIHLLCDKTSMFKSKTNLDIYLECQKKQIQLIQIWEDEWENKQQIVKNMISHKLGVNQQDKIYARKTIVKTITKTESYDFLETNHIQGYVGGSMKYGLYDKENNLVAVGAFKHRNYQEAELVRYATSQTVVGGMGKIIKAFVKDNPTYTQLTTFADHQVSNGGLYETLGFKIVDILKPDYKYVINNTREHKFNYRLKRFKNDPNLKYIEGKTETELAELNHINRVWDSGKTKYQLQLHDKQISTLYLHPDSIIKTTTCHKKAKDITVEDQLFNNKGEVTNILSSQIIKTNPAQSFLEIQTTYDDFNNTLEETDQVTIYDTKHNDIKTVTAKDITTEDYLAVAKPKQNKHVPKYYDLKDFISKDNPNITITVTDKEIIEHSPRQHSFEHSLRHISRSLNLSTTVVQTYYKNLKNNKISTSIYKQKIENYILKHFNSIESWLKYYDEKKTIIRIIPRYIHLNPDFWYFWGIFVGDGHIHTKNPQRKCYTLVENINEGHIVPAWQKIFGEKDGHLVREYKKSSTRKLEGVSVVIANLFRFLLKDWKAASSKHLPAYFLSLNTQNKKALVEGLWESDGTSFNKKSPSFANSSEVLAQQTHLLLLSLGIHNNIRKRISYDHRFDPPTKSVRFDVHCPTNFSSKLVPVQHEDYIFFPVKSIKKRKNPDALVILQIENINASYTSSTCTIVSKGKKKQKKQHKTVSVKKPTITKSGLNKINSLTISLQELKKQQSLYVHNITGKKTELVKLKTLSKQDISSLNLTYLDNNHSELLNNLKQEKFEVIKTHTGTFLKLELEQSKYIDKKWDLVDYIPTEKLKQTSFEYDQNFIYEKSVSSKPYPLSTREVAKDLGMSVSNIYYFSQLETPAKTTKQKKIEEYLLSKNYTVTSWRQHVKKNSHNINIIPRYIHLNSDLMLLLGLFAGNGTTLGKHKSPHYISLCEPEKENLIKPSWEKVFGEKIVNNYSIHPSYKNNEYKVNVFEVHSVILNNFLKDRIGSLITGEEIPQWIVQQENLDLLWDFVRSLWKAKGYMSSESHVFSFYSPSKQVVEDLVKILFRLGIPSRSVPYTSGGAKGARIQTAYNFINTNYFFVEQNNLYIRIVNNDEIDI